MSNNFKSKKGFTLVELLVATAVFMSVMVVAISSLMIIINSNKQSESIKSVVDNVTFAIDNISRNLRSGTDYHCYPETGVPDCPGGGDEISATVTLPNGATTTIFYKFVKNPLGVNEGNIQKCDRSINLFCPLGGWKSMTAPISNVNITNVTFYVLGATQSGKTVSCPSRTQPRIILTGTGQVISKNGNTSDFTLQTTFSRRSRITNVCP